ncbi:MAG: DUF488 family protein [Acidiferrobacterales bacterium]
MIIEDNKIFTVGFGNRRVDQLVGILREFGIRVLVDVRLGLTAESRDVLRQALEEEDIEYHWAGRHLGGNRVSRPGSINTALDNELRGFADYMTSQEFQIGLRQLIGIAGKRPAVMLFTTRLPDKCHRRLIADALMMKGFSVTHILDEAHSKVHELSPALRRESTELVYDHAIPPKNFH